jgi:hypothetical protein
VTDNPYQSPESPPEVEKRPAKPPNRYYYAAMCGLMAFLGLVTSQGVIVGIERAMLPIYALVACLVGILIAWRAFRAPESKWVFAVACLLGVSGYILVFIHMAFFGLK